jgi:outer membrane autotransporter protein
LAIADGVNLRHFNYLAGLAYGKAFAPGAMTVGAFFEHGQGNFDTTNAYGDAGTVRGDSKVHYEGGGALARFEFGGASQSAPFVGGDVGVAKQPSGHAYVEGSLRAGRLSNDYKSRNLEDVSGVKAEYKTSANYFGGHVGGGYIFELAEKTHVDVYGKVLWTRVQGESAKLSTGERLKFDAMHSERVRAGAKWTTEVTKQVAPYVGIAYEYAFNGKAKAEVEGHQLEAPQMKGGTGIVNMGMTFAPGATVPLFIDLDVSGYAGKRQGVAGGVKLKYTW